jgi:peptidoglycan/LPS O-acetylase OafA/YrhL
MRYNPALDGLRAVAVLIVLAHHSWLLPGGWIGVDVFFVLSGYLITSILAHELHQTGSVSFGRFYLRRALRLTPPLAVICLVQFARAPFTAHAGEIREATIVGGLYLENWTNVFHFGDPGVMGHTWSLAVEEQFYWLWPVALVLIVRRRPILWLSGALAVMLIARAVGWVEGAGDGVLQYTFLRPCGLFIGCLLALAPKVEGPRFAVPVMLAAILLLAVVGREQQGAVLLFGPLAASVMAAGTIACLHGGGLSVAALSWGPLRYVGRISYGLYLYSMPIFILAKSEKLPHVPTIVLIPVVFVVAGLSYEFVEKPCLRLKSRVGQRAVLPLAIAAE